MRKLTQDVLKHTLFKRLAHESSPQWLWKHSCLWIACSWYSVTKTQRATCGILHMHELLHFPPALAACSDPRGLPWDTCSIATVHGGSPVCSECRFQVLSRQYQAAVAWPWGEHMWLCIGGGRSSEFRVPLSSHKPYRSCSLKRVANCLSPCVVFTNHRRSSDMDRKFRKLLILQSPFE